MFRLLLSGSLPGIDQDDAGTLEISQIARHNSKTMFQRGCCDQRIGLSAPVRDVKLGTPCCHLVVDGKNATLEGRPNVQIKPGAQLRGLRGITALEGQNASLDLQDRNDRHEELGIVMRGDPGNNARMRLAVTQLAQLRNDVGIEKITHERSISRVKILARSDEKSMSAKPGMESASRNERGFADNRE